MTADWEKATKEFLKKWKDKKEFLGAIVCGSYVTGNPSKQSDIDLHILLSNNADWRERGNTIINGYIVEYFVNPEKNIKKYFVEDYNKNKRICAHMFHTGKILYDSKEILLKLKKESKKWLVKPFKKMTKQEKISAKYRIWDNLLNVQELAESPEFSLGYYNQLTLVYSYYAKYLQTDIADTHKILRFLKNNQDQKKYMVKKFPDSYFTKLFTQAIIEKSNKEKIKIIETISWYVINKLGGIDFSNFKLKTKI